MVSPSALDVLDLEPAAYCFTIVIDPCIGGVELPQDGPAQPGRVLLNVRLALDSYLLARSGVEPSTCTGDTLIRVARALCKLFEVPSELWSFIAVAAIVVVVPGADMALVARNTVAGGRRSGFRTATGTILGLSVHAAAAVVGLSAVIAASATAFNVVKLLGAAYLVWLGVQTVWSTRRRRTPLPDSNRRKVFPSFGGTPLIQGFLTNVLNPKLAMFFLSFLPQFVDPRTPAVTQTLILAGVFIIMGVVWLGVYVAAIDLLSGVLSKPNVKRWSDRIVGTVLAGLGLRLAASSAE